MNQSLLALLLFIGVPVIGLAADMKCPPMPDEMTKVSRDVTVDIRASAGKLGKFAAAEVAARTDATAKSIFDKYPNLDKLIVLQTLTSTYCSALNTSGISGAERLERWERFMERYLELKATVPKPSKPVTIERKVQPAKAANPAASINNPAQKAQPSSSATGTPALVAPSPDDRYRTALELASAGQVERSVVMLRELANNGHARAQYQLGRMYILGDSLPQSYKEAFRWFSLSAKGGLPAAQHNLAVLYQDGLGTSLDENQALIWFAEAARGGFFASQELLRKQGRTW